MSFFDSDKFMFVMMEDGHLSPVHYRELGEKEGNLYSKSVTWSDVAINNVPLEQTFKYEDEITHAEDSIDTTEKGVIIVNERLVNPIINDDDENPSIHQAKKWMKRLEKAALNPISLPEAKMKKKGPQRFLVKPKCKKEVRDEKIHHSSDKFQELVDVNDLGVLEDFQYTIRCRDGYEKMISWDDGDARGYNVKKEVRYIPKFKDKTYSPPEHWLTPVVQWENIWIEMDEIEHGHKRDYIYVPEGETCPGFSGQSSIMGPAIYFFGGDYTHEWISANL
jgi:hypothetical protein